MENGTFTLNRTGNFTLKNKSKNQCRAIGHEIFSYHVLLNVKPVLDKQGFIVDHEVINKAVQRAVNKATSCELLCLHICKEIESTLKKMKKDFNSIKVIIKADPNPVAWMEFEMLPN